MSNEISTTREKVLREAIHITQQDRNIDYGSPEDNFGDIADFWNVYLAGPKRALVPADVAVMQILQKIARIRQSPDKADHWVDIAGYAACGAECADVYRNKSVGNVEPTGVAQAEPVDSKASHCNCPRCSEIRFQSGQRPDYRMADFSGSVRGPMAATERSADLENKLPDGTRRT